ncbi:MAG: hypothetical protein ACRDSF_11025 [Pseudonocardiaceae bacterium]
MSAPRSVTVDHALQECQAAGEPSLLQMPDPQFPHKIPAGRRSSRPAPGPAPGGQPDPSPRASRSSGGQLRWARCPDDGLLHLLHPADVVVAATGGHAEALCGRQLPAESLTLINGLDGALCMACVAGIPPDSNDPGPRGTP